MEIEEIRKYVLRPNDRLIIRIPAGMGQKQITYISETIKNWAGDVPYLIVGPGIEIEVAQQEKEEND